MDEQHNNLKDALLVLSGNDTYDILYNSIRRLLNGVESDNVSVAQNYADQKDVLNAYIREEKDLLEQQASIVHAIEQGEEDLRKENEEYAANGGVSLDEWKRLQQDLKNEENCRDHLNWEQKNAALETLPYIIVRDLLKKIRKQISQEKEQQAYKVLQASLTAPTFANYLHRIIKKTSSQDCDADTVKLIEAIRSYFEDSHLNEIKETLKLSEDESSSVLAKISAVEQFEISTFSENLRRIAESIQRSKVIRSQLQKSSVENFEDHVHRVADITAQVQNSRDSQVLCQSKLSNLQEQTIVLEKTLEATKKSLETELKKQSVSALSDRTLLLVEELQETQNAKMIAAVECDINRKFKELLRKDDFVDYIYLDPDFSLHLVRNQAVDIGALRVAASKHGTYSLKSVLKERAYQSLIAQLKTSEDSLSFALSTYSGQNIILPIELDHTYFSNGEKQILVMSLYWAIMNQSKNELPFIIDTPFARIDTEHRANITELFFKELHGQLFVLSTNEELRYKHLAALDQQIAKKYMLIYDESKRTQILEGNYFEEME